MSKEPFEFQPMVDKGCKLLDERLGPEWVEKIDLRQLNLQSGCACILGQTSLHLGGTVSSYMSGARICFPTEKHFIDQEAAEAHGFVLLDDGAPLNYPALTECWRNTILARRAES